jgi:hypothetical protein
LTKELPDTLQHISTEKLVDIVKFLSSNAQCTSKTGAILGTDALQKICKESILRLEDRKFDLSQIVQLIDHLKWNTDFLLMAYSVLLEKHAYKTLSIENLVTLLTASYKSGYQNRVLVDLGANWLCLRIAKEKELNSSLLVKAIKAIAYSYAKIDQSRLNGLLCKAAAHPPTSLNEAVELLVAGCHFDEVFLSPSLAGVLDNLLTFKNLCKTDPQSLAGIALCLAKATQEKSGSCACSMSEESEIEPIIDYRAVRAAYKLTDQWKKKDRKYWMRKREPPLRNLIHGRQKQLDFDDGRLTCEIPLDGNLEKKIEISQSLILKILQRVYSVGFLSQNVALKTLNGKLLPRIITPSLVIINEEIAISLPESALTEAVNKLPISWKQQPLNHMQYTASDFLASLQLLFIKDQVHIELLDETTLRSFAEIAKICNELVSDQTERQESDECGQVRSSLAKILPIFTEDSTILKKNRILNFHCNTIVFI